jgi:ferredoxin-thioredoxin reductase catalytic subunit
VSAPKDTPRDTPDVSPEEVQRLYERLDKEAESAGYHLNPNKEFTLGLIRGMLVNERRYGYWACPCRLASGVKKEDLDIICPCDYRDADVSEYGSCFCALYVSQEIKDGKRKATRVPERRPAEGMATPAERMGGQPPGGGQAGGGQAGGGQAAGGAQGGAGGSAARGTPGPALPDLSGLRYPLWRCRVCGYLCARDNPPDVCPICKARKDRFEKYLG